MGAESPMKYFRSHRSLVLVAISAFVLWGCSGDPDPQDSGVVHQGDEVDDVGGDAAQDVDETADGEDDDAGEDGDDEVDPCLEPGPDRDRDGVIDRCDHHPFYYDPQNPEELEYLNVREDSSGDGLEDGPVDVEVALPFAVEGAILEVDGVDFYRFELDEPGTVLIHLEGMTQAIWPAVIFIGDGPTTDGYQAAILGDGNGAEVVQDVHLPLPGRYVVAVSDFRNVSENPSVGGPDYRYRLAVSAPPLPAAEALSLPAPRQIVTYRREPVLFSVDVSGEDALHVNVTATPKDSNSLLLPSIQVRDGDTGQMLAFTLEEQVEVDRLQNELTVKIGPDIERVEVLLDAHLIIGRNDLVVDIGAISQPRDLETYQEPRDSRRDHLLWMTAGAEVEAEIGPPKRLSETSLAGDEDYFLVYAERGQVFEVIVEPINGSLLAPEIEFGEFWLFSGSDYFFPWHELWGVGQRGEASRLAALITADRQGELGVLVRHSDNYFNALPVGGPRYEYRLTIQEREDPAELVEELPARLPVILEEGDQALFEVLLRGGRSYRFEYNGDWSHPLQVINGEGWVVEHEVQEEAQIVEVDEDRRYFLGVRDSMGWEIVAEDEVFITIEEI